MGEVYRARDAGLNRDVALKVLPDLFAADPDRLVRFKREAQILASLNHPNIAHVYGLEQSDGVQALVMELVEGPTLADRIAQGLIPVDESLPIAKQIAEALEAAHEQGIIHRDLKPANIKVRPDGTVKVLDFGLAKLTAPTSPAGSAASVSLSPTITSPAMMTGVGVLLGTAAYMSPEQAKGREADKRSDIWAFGAVLYEMLTGRRAFEGEDLSDTFANVLKTDPDWSALPLEIPPALRTLLQSCLTKDRQRRVADISTARFVLEHDTSLAPAGTLSATPPRRLLWRRVIIMPVAAAFAASLVVSAATWFAMRPADQMPPRVSRLLFTPTGNSAMTINNPRDWTITPDGTRLIYVGNGGTQLFVRPLDALEPVPVFTGQPSSPFVSPDGQWIGFFDGVSLKRVAITGGPPEPLGLVASSSLSRGATWGPNDTIILGTEHVTTGLQRVGAVGQPTIVLTSPNRSQGELFHVWPEILPGGRAVLFTITALGGPDAAQVVALDLRTGTRKILVRGGSNAHYMPSGHLVYAATDTLRAVAFDVDRLETRGPTVTVVTDVVRGPSSSAYAAVASDGTLVYATGTGLIGNQSPRTLVWVDRQGRESPIAAPPRPYLYPRLSPEGNRVALRSIDQARDIWVWDLARPTLTRVTSDAGYDGYPLWTPDGSLVFSSDRAGARDLFVKAADATGAVERLTNGPYSKYATAVSRDGRRLIFTEESPKTNDDIMELQLNGARAAPVPLVQSPYAERNGVISPDGRWLAYEANDSGRGFQVSVRPYPDVNSGQWQVSTTGGTRPLWAPSGAELFYVSPAGAIMRVGIGLGSSWAATTPTELIQEGYFTLPEGSNGRTYDIAADGRRFLMLKQDGDSAQTAAPDSLVIVLNWTEELKRLVPTN